MAVQRYTKSHNSNSEKMGCISFQEKVGEKGVSSHESYNATELESLGYMSVVDSIGLASISLM